MNPPKVFISYSWSTPSHESWVIDLGESLMASGIEVKLDKWDLKPGHDAVAFMESMVTDPTIDKVIIVCDRVYSKKADGRHGGVGTETQIISKKVYEKVDQERFIAVIAEKDEDGKAYTPVFYHSRLYIDLSNPESYSDNFEQLIRCIFNQPQHKKPQLGKKPDFLSNEITINLGTSPLAKRANTSIREVKPNATATLEEYLTTFSSNLERIRLETNHDTQFDDQVLNSINEFTTARNELLQVVTNAIRYLNQLETGNILHSFLESTLKYQDCPPGKSSWNDTEFDNFRFIIHELFLYVTSICLKHNKLDIVKTLLNKQYYIKERGSEAYLAGFECFYKDVGSLEYRNRRLELGRTSFSADVTKDNNKACGIDFNDLMQTDFLLFARSQIHSVHWWPKTLVYLGHYPGAFEIFTRSTSTQYFENLKLLLNVQNKNELVAFAETASLHSGRYYGLNTWRFDWKRLMNLDGLATQP
ncbi:hypothetical protein DT037_14135 [Pseudomonas fulva]|uniref:SEFIR domain-containing protein n=1 Tax=Pseudomonas fulva TaxID=47880 RepID=UPI0015F684AA|nr:SEFIR domain-containing protein [Pseudomonas fulva]MBA5708202.1 hypothetical protein [Pseudomonas fulva]